VARAVVVLVAVAVAVAVAVLVARAVVRAVARVVARAVARAGVGGSSFLTNYCAPRAPICSKKQWQEVSVWNTQQSKWSK
jgi:hypothetical protein